MTKPSAQMNALSRALQDCGGEAPLAKKLGVSVEVLSGWLRGRDVLPAEMYIRARELAAVRRR
jgi:DNA-binding transcriptional regulator YdaS (Cro superfamily)